MPKEKQSEKLIAKIYRRKYEDIFMLAWVEAQKSLVPAISVERSMYNLFRYIGEEDFNIESALTIYARLKKEYYESAKTNN